MNKTLWALAVLAAAASGCASDDRKTTTVSQAAIAAPVAVAPAPRNCVPPPNELVIKQLAPGTGTDAVRFRSAILASYTGWLYDGCAADLKGAIFDTSEGKAPISFMIGVGRVIRGWDEGLIGMKEGEKRLLVIPPDKGYGANAAPGGRIPANSTLVFEVTLEKIIMQAQ